MVRSHEVRHDASEPHKSAAASLSPLGYLAIKRHIHETRDGSLPIVTPEGYDVSTVTGAIDYLTEVHGRDVPVIRSAEDVMDALQAEPRAAMYKDGRPQSVYDHTMRLLDMCEADLAGRTDLDPDLVKLMALSHDWVEIFAGDTVVTDRVAMASKYHREAAGWTLLRHYLPSNDPCLAAAAAYQDPSTPAERRAAAFVHAYDKIEAYDFQLQPDVQATLHRLRQEDYKAIVRMAVPKALIDPTAAGLMQATLVRLGQNWNSWGCKPFEGNPADIVGQAVNQAMAELTAGQPRISRLPLLRSTANFNPAMSARELESLGVPILETIHDKHPSPPSAPLSPGIRLAA
jgi:5'-deoxynucleotidase YfbR-like HD superfamily hydrolase